MLDGNVCALELCAGSGTVARAWGNLGMDVTTVDWDDSLPDIDLVEDIRNLDPLDWQHIDVIWFSPDCTCYSVMSFPQGHFKDGEAVTDAAKEAEEIVKAGLDFIAAVKPRFWFMENPRALLRKRPMVQELERVTVTYCQYRPGSMKPTDIWGVFPLSWEPLACKNGDPCHTPAPRGSRTGTQGPQTAAERAIVPFDLALTIGRHIWSEYHGGHLFA